MLILREYDFVWRKPDSRRSDTIAYFEIPQDIDYVARQGTEFKTILPAKAVVATDATPAIDTSITTSDVANATVDGVANTISFQLPHFEASSFYDVKDLVEIIQVTGASTYTQLTYTSGAPAAGEWTYDTATKTFTVALSSAASVTLYVYYAPKGGQVKLVHKVTGAVRSEISVAVSSTNQHILYDPGRNPPRYQTDEILASRTFLEIHVYPRTINGSAMYEFDPLRPDNTISDVCLVEIPVDRA